MAVIEARKAIGMFSDYYNDIEVLERKKYIEGTDSASKINKKIRSLIELSFDNASDKLDNYEMPTLYAVTSGRYDQTVEKNAQEHYESQLEFMKTRLSEYTEELRKINEMQEKLDNISEIKEKIKEATFEAKQQSEEATFEAKQQSEEATFEAKQQSEETELKPSDEIMEKIDYKLDKQESNKATASKIQELKTQFKQLGEELSKINNKVSSQNQVSNQEEDLWYEDVMRKTEEPANSYAKNARVEAKRHYSEIKIIKMEILEIEKEVKKQVSNQEEKEIKKQLGLKKFEFNLAMKNLASIWSEYS